MKVAIIGCGNIAKTHLSVLSGMDNITISAFVDICEDKAKALAEEYGAGAYSDYVTMLDELRPDSVHICTPHYLHKEMSVNCLKRGIHVLCEKPAVVSYEELGTLRSAQDNSSAYFGVCLQNRYNESVKKALEIIKDSTLGKLIGIRGNVFWC
ncbi:MAG: Gfo/Idh/MocA family oxidoreductase, partial [Clostridiales bacterium]|nr:Gfo/Idh/MocA family oxidoreductase [Clostridiales bacterium]